MINCDKCKNNYYSDDNPDTVCEGKCRKRTNKEYTNEMLVQDCKQRTCRFFDPINE